MCLCCCCLFFSSRWGYWSLYLQGCISDLSHDEEQQWWGTSRHRENFWTFTEPEDRPKFCWSGSAVWHLFLKTDVAAFKHTIYHEGQQHCECSNLRRHIETSPEWWKTKIYISCTHLTSRTINQILQEFRKPSLWDINTVDTNDLLRDGALTMLISKGPLQNLEGPSIEIHSTSQIFQF